MNVFRASLHRNDIDVVAINDLLDIDHLIYLLKYDSVHGNCDATIIADDDGIIVNGQKLLFFQKILQILIGKTLESLQLLNQQVYLH